jgi:hypothetical protein
MKMAEIEIFRARNTTGFAINNIRVTKTKPYGLIQTMQRYVADDKAIIDAIGADVQPIRHGRWIIEDDVEHFIAVCSECGRTEDSRDINEMPYCHCGARMDGGTENG